MRSRMLVIGLLFNACSYLFGGVAIACNCEDRCKDCIGAPVVGSGIWLTDDCKSRCKIED